MEKISLRYDNVLSDYVSAVRLYDANATSGRIGKALGVLLLVVGALELYWVGIAWESLGLIAAAPIAWFDLLPFSLLQAWIELKRNPKLRETYELEFSDAGIHFKTASIDSNIAWTHYSKVLENERVFLLVYGRQMYSVIPKRAFENDEEIAEFRDMLDRHIGRG